MKRTTFLAMLVAAASSGGPLQAQQQVGELGQSLQRSSELIASARKAAKDAQESADRLRDLKARLSGPLEALGIASPGLATQLDPVVSGRQQDFAADPIIYPRSWGSPRATYFNTYSGMLATWMSATAGQDGLLTVRVARTVYMNSHYDLGAFYLTKDGFARTEDAPGARMTFDELKARVEPYLGADGRIVADRLLADPKAVPLVSEIEAPLFECNEEFPALLAKLKSVGPLTGYSAGLSKEGETGYSDRFRIGPISIDVDFAYIHDRRSMEVCRYTVFLDDIVDASNHGFALMSGPSLKDLKRRTNGYADFELLIKKGAASASR